MNLLNGLDEAKKEHLMKQKNTASTSSKGSSGKRDSVNLEDPNQVLSKCDFIFLFLILSLKVPYFFFKKQRITATSLETIDASTSSYISTEEADAVDSEQMSASSMLINLASGSSPCKNTFHS